MYNIKERQIQKAIRKYKERPYLIEILEKTGVVLSEKEKENILIFGDFRGPYAVFSTKVDIPDVKEFEPDVKELEPDPKEFE